MRRPSQRATNAHDDQIQAPQRRWQRRRNEDNPAVAPPRDAPVHQTADLLAAEVLQQIVATATEQVTQHLAPIVNPAERNQASQVISQPYHLPLNKWKAFLQQYQNLSRDLFLHRCQSTSCL